MLRVRISSLPIMTSIFSTHLKELFLRVSYFFLSWFLAIIVAYEYKENILLWITHRVFLKEIEIIYLSLPEALWNFLLISVWSGFLISAPWAILNIYAYLRSGFYQYEAHRWDIFIGILVLSWIPFHYWQISVVWPNVANWFLSYGEEYSNLSYLPTMNQFFSFLLNWSTITSFFLFLFMTLLFKVFTVQQETMRWYTDNREKILLGTLLIGGVITPPDLVSQVMVALVVLGTIETVVLLESIKLGWYNNKEEERND